MTEAEVIAKVVRWVAARTSLLTIQGEQSEQLPEWPTRYLVVRLSTISEMRDSPEAQEIVDDEPGDPETTISQIPTMETEWRFSIHAYGPNPTAALQLLRAGSHVQSVNTILSDAGLELHETSLIRNLPEFLNEKWQPRAQIDLFIRGLTRQGDVVDVIEEYAFEHERDA